MPSVYDYRHIELDRVGAGKKRWSDGNRHSVHRLQEDTQSRLFGSTPSTPTRKLSADSLVTMSPGRVIKANQMRSNIFPFDSSSSVDDTDTASVASSPAVSLTKQRLFGSTCSPPSTPRKMSTDSASLVTMSPGRVIKMKQTRSNVFPSEPNTHSYGLSSSSSSSVDLTDSASVSSPLPTTP